MSARGTVDKTLLYTSLFLGLFGVVMIYSASSIMADGRFGNHLHFLQRQIIWLLISCVAVYFILKIDLKRRAVYTPIFLLGVIFALSIVFLMPSRNEAHRWLFLGPMTMQPAEFAKIGLIYYLAFSLAKPSRDVTVLKQLLIPYLPIVAIILGLIALQPDLGMVIVIAVTALGMLFMAGAPLKFLLGGTLPLGGLAAFLVFGLGYKIARVHDFISTLENPLAGSYQIKQAILTLGAGGVFGSGLGDGRQKLFFLPYPHTDFIFASIGEEIGFLGMCALLLCFLITLYRGFKIAAYQPDRFGYLFASGLTLSLFFNIAINIGVVTSLIPTTGLPLPFLSYGGSSLLVTAISIGLLLNLSRRRDGWVA